MMQATEVFVGTYVRQGLHGADRGVIGRGEGLYRLAFDEEAGTLSPLCVHEGVVNPSWLTLAPDGKRLYCVHEMETWHSAVGGGVSGYAVGTDSLELLGSRATHGIWPCHVALRPQGDWLAVSNYGSGSLSVLPVDAAGKPGAAQVIVHEGKGTNPARQEGPHVHSALFTPDGGHVLVMDLGLDTVTAYAASGEGISPEGRAVSTPPGAGARMAAYDAGRGLLYLVCEMGSEVATFACDAQGVPMRLLHRTDTLPQGADRTGTAADIRLSADGRFLYTSNRGHNSLTVFAVAPETGALSMVQNIESGGQTPRGFTLSPSGRWLLCGNQDSDTIAVLAVDSEKGTLARHTQIALPSPVCLVFRPDANDAH